MTWISLQPGDESPGAAHDRLPHDVDSALRLAKELALVPGGGRTRELWETLASVAAVDLGAARAMEPHLDAVAILDQAGESELLGDRSWGVYAAEGGDAPLQFLDGHVPVLRGTKPWCSLANRLDRALVTAHLPAGGRVLVAVDLRDPGVAVEAGAWHARGLSEIPSGPVHFRDVPASPVGEPGWYLERPGFAWGGMSVAACWFGGAVGVARTVFDAATRRDDPYLLAHLGAVDEAVESARRALAEAARLVDEGSATGDDGAVLAKRVRATVARAGESVLGHAARALGPAPLALDAVHAKRVADLAIYLRQFHAERDDASLARKLLASGGAPW